MPASPAHKSVTYRFGRRMRSLRTKSNLTQAEMAKALGMDRSFISDIERGLKSPSLKTIEIIALGFQMPMRELMDGLDA